MPARFGGVPTASAAVTSTCARNASAGNGLPVTVLWPHARADGYLGDTERQVNNVNAV
jgi:hypothetical protein